MKPLSEILRQSCDNIRQRPALQHSWEVSLAVCLTGFLLLGCRLLGSFQPDADPVRGLGLLLLINGIVLTTFWVLKHQVPGPFSHLLCWGALLGMGTFWINLALMPLHSWLAVLGGLCSLLGVIGLGLDQLLHSDLNSQTACQKPPVAEADASADKAVSRFAATGPLTAPSPAVNDQNLLQWLSRRHEADGSEVVEGMVRLELSAGQMQRSAHVVFAPSLQGIPEMECEPLGDAEVETILGDVYPHGFRVDLRRVGSDRSAQTVEIGFQAVCSNHNKSAA